jgi:hypothetical protein
MPLQIPVKEEIDKTINSKYHPRISGIEGSPGGNRPGLHCSQIVHDSLLKKEQDGKTCREIPSCVQCLLE